VALGFSSHRHRKNIYHSHHAVRETSVTDTSIPADRQTESRISQLTMILGALAALPVAYFDGWRWGIGIFIGSALAWFNFRWLKQGVDALAEASSAQAHQKEPAVPVATYFKAMFRYGLIALSVYVIFKYLNVPVLSMVFGLCALGAATIVVSVHSILRSRD
jgi:small-conductance mechanosensitive channel